MYDDTQPGKRYAMDLEGLFGYLVESGPYWEVNHDNLDVMLFDPITTRAIAERRLSCTQYSPK
jgi:hypothetical protein